MAPQQQPEAISRIAKASAVAVVLPEQPPLHVIAAASALVSGLRAAGKAVSAFAPPIDLMPGNARAPAPWAEFATDSEPLREFIISFDLTRSPIRELKYERGENRLDIILSPTGPVRREDVEFRLGALRYDLVLAIGVPSPEAANASIRSAPELFHERPVLNIDAAPENRRWGDINLTPHPDDAEPSTLAEFVSGLLSAIGVPDDPNRASALLASLVAETRGFDAERTGAGAFALAGALKRAGADPSALRRLSASTLPAAKSGERRFDLAELQLAGRAVARSRLDAPRRLLIAVLTTEDFGKTATTPEAIPLVWERLLDAVPQGGSLALVWQEPGGTVRLLFGSADEPVPEANKMIFPSFSDAEAEIHRLLERPDAIE